MGLLPDVNCVPFIPLIVPLVCKLSPLQPGYVTTVWAEMIVERSERHDAAVRSERGEPSIMNSRLIMYGEIESAAPNNALKSCYSLFTITPDRDVRF